MIHLIVKLLQLQFNNEEKVTKIEGDFANYTVFWFPRPFQILTLSSLLTNEAGKKDKAYEATAIGSFNELSFQLKIIIPISQTSLFESSNGLLS